MSSPDHLDTKAEPDTNHGPCDTAVDCPDVGTRPGDMADKDTTVALTGFEAWTVVAVLLVHPVCNGTLKKL